MSRYPEAGDRITWIGERLSDELCAGKTFTVVTHQGHTCINLRSGYIPIRVDLNTSLNWRVTGEEKDEWL